MDALEAGRSGTAAIGAFENGFVISGEFHGEMQFTEVAKPDNAKDETAVVHIDVREHMGIMADHTGLAIAAGDHIENDCALQIAGVAPQGDGDAGLVVELPFPHADP